VIELLISGGFVLLLDQWTKKSAEARVRNPRFLWRGFVRIRSVRHPRKRYGSASTRITLILIWLAALTSSLVLYRAAPGFHTHTALIGLGSALGGAAGNLLNIWKDRSIIDFIDLRWWPVFNLADVAIAGGIALAFWPRS
jgi:signal peptidase II